MNKYIKQHKGITGMTIKLIASIAMFLDHAAVTFLEPLMMNGYQLYPLYGALRVIGRLAFPLYIFLMVEGFSHTRSRSRYAINMAIFAVISEIPFDLMVTHGEYFIYSNAQNVFLTLLIGFFTIWGIDLIARFILPRGKMRNYIKARTDYNDREIMVNVMPELRIALGVLLMIVVIVAGAFSAEVLRTDYGMWGVLAMVVMYFLRSLRYIEVAAGVITLSIAALVELAALPDAILIHFYNNKRGKGNKYFFYAFYPGHLLLLWAIAKLTGII
ncbi:MAG: hypothetical protein J5749_04995 [Lachnospiraceae bacterium]|nr:hypothetical protein [Lachnospiraceae bacterium]